MANKIGFLDSTITSTAPGLICSKPVGPEIVIPNTNSEEWEIMMTASEINSELTVAVNQIEIYMRTRLKSECAPLQESLAYICKATLRIMLLQRMALRIASSKAAAAGGENSG